MNGAIGPTAVRRFRVQFREQVGPGDVLELDGKTVGQGADGLPVELELLCPRRHGALAVRAWASVIAEERRS